MTLVEPSSARSAATPAELPALWRAQASALERFAEPAAAAFRQAADQLEESLRVAGDEPLSLVQAAHESGYSVDRLRHMVADNEVPNAGKKGAPRIRRRDLPRRPLTRPERGYNAETDAQSLMAVRR